MISFVNLSKRPYLLLFTIALAALLVVIYPLLFGSDVHHASANGGDEGSHFRYGSLRWASIDPSTGEVEFRLTAAFRRDSNWGPANTGDIITETQGPSTFNFGDGNVTGTLQFLITSHDVAENWVIGEALDPVTGTVGIRHTYAGPGPFTAYIGGFSSSPPLNNVGCCRIGQTGFPTTPPLNNRAGFPYPLQTAVTPMSGNSSPVSGLVPIVFVPQSAVAKFLVPAADPDGDPIQWRMSTDAEAGGCCHPAGMNIDPSTGVVTWNNFTSGPGGTALDSTDHWTAQVVIEDLDSTGNVKSQGVVDFLLKIVLGNPPVFIPPTPADGTVFTVGVGSTFNFTVAAQDPDAGQTVTLNHGGLPAGASFPLPAPANPVQSILSWTPTVADVGVHIVTFIATENVGLTSLPTSVIIKVVPEADLAVTKDVEILCLADDDDDGDDNGCGDEFGDDCDDCEVKFTVTVTNNGPGDPTGVQVADGLAFVYSTADVGAYDPDTGVWTIGDLAVGDTATLMITARLFGGDDDDDGDDDDCVTITNTAEVSSELDDPDLSNNVASASIQAGGDDCDDDDQND